MSERWSDRRRFEELYRSTYPHVVAYCRRRLPIDDVEDVVVEIYTIAWQKQHRFINADAPLAWLYGVGFRVVSEHRRTTKRRRTLHRRLDREPQRRPPIPDTVVAAGDEAERVFAALADLAPRDRELVGLWAFEELSYDEIATLTGLSRAAVRSALYHARQRLSALRDSAERSGS